MKLEYLTDKGLKKSDNQDYVGAFTNQAGRVLAIIADGVTSTFGGDVASAMAVEHLGHLWENTDIDLIKEAVHWYKATIRRENSEILKAAKRFEDLKNMATTVVAVIVFDEQIILANLGDSKAFLLHDGKLEQISHDHSVADEMIRMGKLGRESAQKLPQAKAVTRYLGVNHAVNVEVSLHRVEEGDSILLATDGLTKVVNNHDITDILSSENVTESEKVMTLVNAANDAGGPDNISVLLIAK